MVRNTLIRSVAHYVPPRVVTNHDLSKLMDTSDEWIIERTGIRERRFVEAETPCSFLAAKAAEEALATAGVEPRDIDYLIASTVAPDYYFPGIGVLLQNKLGMKHVPALDIRVQCSGLVYGISLAKALINSGEASSVLLVCAEVQSTGLDLSTRGREMAVLFGDGAGALVLQVKESQEPPRGGNEERGIIDSILGSDGSGAESLIKKGPGTSIPGFMREEDFKSGLYYPYMDGKVVFKQAVVRMCEVASCLLERNNIQAGKIDFLVPHQANLRINEAVRERLGIPKEKAISTIHKYGNTTSASIPIGLSEAVQEGRLKEGNLVLTLAFGSGFTWGGNLIRW